MSTNETRLIRKYVNRRLYDTRQSRYVNLDDLRELVSQGVEIKVVEQATGTDITTPVLLQIIAESEKGGAHLLRADFLAGLIRVAGRDDSAQLALQLNQALKSVLGNAAPAAPASARPAATAPTSTYQPLNPQS
jgi:polyhydroxyalkanoate synthesis repressor PhaR